MREGSHAASSSWRPGFTYTISRDISDQELCQSGLLALISILRAVQKAAGSHLYQDTAVELAFGMAPCLLLSIFFPRRSVLDLRVALVDAVAALVWARHFQDRYETQYFRVSMDQPLELAMVAGLGRFREDSQDGSSE